MFLRANKVPNDINKWIVKRLIKKNILEFSAANLALAGFPLTNAPGESMPSRL